VVVLHHRHTCTHVTIYMYTLVRLDEDRAVRCYRIVMLDGVVVAPVDIMKMLTVDLNHDSHNEKCINGQNAMRREMQCGERYHDLRIVTIVSAAKISASAIAKPGETVT
jgi:hypothetical protein